MEVLAIIPARGGSKGIPGKNIKLLNNRPLIDYSIKAGHDSKYVTRTVLSTEDEKVKKVALECGVEVVDRPIELAQDTTMTIPVMIDVVKQLEKKEGYMPDVVILLQPTCPLRGAEQIDKGFELFLNSDCDSVFAVTKGGLTHGAWRKFPNKNEFEPLYDSRTRPRRQDIDRHYTMYWETGSLYICKAEVMLRVNDFIGEKPMIIELPSGDIDTIEDFMYAENILKTTTT